MIEHAYLTEDDLYAEVYARTVARSGRERHWRDLLYALEEQGWIAWQAGILGGFEAPSRELERYVLPYLAERGEWDRFLRHALVAAQLRGMAEALEEGPVLASLAAAERLDLARALAARLPDPWRRARARAEIAAVLPPESPPFGALTREIEEDLKSGTALEPGSAALCLAGVARRLAYKLPRILAATIERFAHESPQQAGPVWRALAEGLFAAGELEDPQLWTALWSIDQARGLPVLRPPPERLEAWLRKIALEMADAPGAARWWLAWPAVEGAVRGGTGGSAWTTAAQLLGPMPLSLDWVKRAWSIWPVLSEERWHACAETAPSPEARVALRVARIGQESPPEPVDEARAAIEELTPGEAQLHLALRLLEQCNRQPRRTFEGRLAAVAYHLRRIRYAAPPGDLRRFLDLVAQTHGGKILRQQVEDVLWAPGSSAETLRHLAEHAGSETLLEELFERTEEHAAMAAESSAEGFELRQRVLIILAARLSVQREDLERFEDARERLLPEETDDLAEAAAEALAAAGLRGLAGVAADALPVGPRRLRVLVDVRPPGVDLDELLSPAGLYAAVADPRAVADELSCLSALLEVPEAPGSAEAIAREHLDGVADPGRRIEGLIDLARHAMAYQEARLPKRLRDFPAAVLPLKQALGVVPSDDWLLGVTPELVEVGARLGERQAVAEVEEAWERIGQLEGVPAERRSEAWLRLLGLLPRLLPGPRRSRRFEWLVGWLEARLSDVEGPREHLRAKLEAVRDGQPEPAVGEEDEISLDRLEDEVGGGALDASGPRTMPLRRRLWEVEDPALLPALAQATLRALDTEGKEGGENALRWFLNAYLAPRLGEGGGEVSRGRRERVRGAIEVSRRIVSEGVASPTGRARRPDGRGTGRAGGRR